MERTCVFSTSAWLKHPWEVTGLCFHHRRMYQTPFRRERLAYSPQAHAWNTLRRDKLMHSPQAHASTLSKRDKLVYSPQAHVWNTLDTGHAYVFTTSGITILFSTICTRGTCTPAQQGHQPPCQFTATVESLPQGSASVSRQGWRRPCWWTTTTGAVDLLLYNKTTGMSTTLSKNCIYEMPRASARSRPWPSALNDNSLVAKIDLLVPCRIGTTTLTSSWMTPRRPFRHWFHTNMDDVLSKHFTLQRNVKNLEYGLDLDKVVDTRVELISAKRYDPILVSTQGGGSQLVHRPHSKLSALGIALACSEIADWYPFARLVWSAFFPEYGTLTLATGMLKSPANQDDFARSPILVETEVTN